jgi:hypothetical protein
LLRNFSVFLNKLTETNTLKIFVVLSFYFLSHSMLVCSIQHKTHTLVENVMGQRILRHRLVNWHCHCRLLH